METLLAAEIGEQNICVVSAAIHDASTFSIIKSRKWPLPPPPPDEPSEEELRFYQDRLFDVQTNIRKDFGDSHSTVLATFHSSSTLFTSLELPFSETKKIEPVLPLQIQDVVPFDVDDFMFDPTVIRNIKENSYEVLVAYTTVGNVDSALGILKGAGIDPKLLTPKASSLIGIALVLPKIFETNSVLLSTSAIALFVDGRAVTLRDLPEFEPDEALSGLLYYVQSLIEKAEEKFDTKIDYIYFAGAEYKGNALSKALKRNVTILPLSHFTSEESDLDIPVEELPWAIGLLAREARFLLGSKNKSLPLFNFRKGKYVYRAFFVDLVRYIKEEALFFSLFVGAVFFFLFASLFSTTFISSTYETPVMEALSEAFPGEDIPLEEAESFTRDKVFSVQNQLMAFGSLENESALTFLRDFTLAVPASIALDISKMEIDLDGSFSAEIFGTVSSSSGASGMVEAGNLQKALRQPFGSGGKWCLKDEDFDAQSARSIGTESKASIRMRIIRCES